MIEGALLRLARIIDARYRAIACACILFAVLAACGVAFLPLNTNLLDVLPSENPEVRRFSSFLERFGLLEGLVVVVESPEPDPALLVDLADSIGEKLSASPRIESVDSNYWASGSGFFDRFPLYLDREGIRLLAQRLSPEGIRAQVARNRDALLSPFANPLEAELIRNDPLSLREIVGRHLRDRFAVRGLDLSTGHYLDPSRTLAILYARPAGEIRDIAFVRALSRDVHRIFDEIRRESDLPEGVRFGITGGFARAAEISGAIWKDMVRSFAISLFLVLALILWFLRPPAAVLGMIVLTLALSLLATMTIAFALYGSLNIVTSIVATMLIGLYIDYQIHIFFRFQELLRDGSGLAAALETALSGIGKAILSSSLTTAASFFSVIVTSFRGLHELGVVSGFGILFCLATNLVFFPSLLRWLAGARPSRILAGRPAPPGSGLLGAAVPRHRRAILATAPLLFLVFAIGVPRIRFVTDLDSLGLRRSPARDAGELVRKRTGDRGEPLFLMAEAGAGGDIDRTFDVLEAQGAEWTGEERVREFLSPGILLPPPSAQERTARALVDEGLPRSVSADSLARRMRREMVRAGMNPGGSLETYATRVAGAVTRRTPIRLFDLPATGTPRIRRFLHRETGSLGAYLFPPGNRFEREEIRAFRDDVARLGPAFFLTGTPVLYEEIRSSILKDSALAVLLTFAANLLILRLHFRDWGRVLGVMLPVTAGVLLTVGSMGLLGISFNFFNIAAIPLIFGFGVDYGIYVMQASSGGGGRASHLRGTEGLVLLCAATTIASCGSLFTLSYRGLASIGSVLSLGSVACVYSSLLLLPAVLRRTTGGDRDSP